MDLSLEAASFFLQTTMERGFTHVYMQSGGLNRELFLELLHQQLGISSDFFPRSWGSICFHPLPSASIRSPHTAQKPV